MEGNQIMESLVGRKAFGLSCLPPEWAPPCVPRFFVITADSRVDEIDESLAEARIAVCLQGVDIDSGSRVIVRSSGTSETMEKRGQLASRECSADQILST